MDILYGRNPVLEALRSGRPARKLVLANGVQEDKRLGEILQLAHEAEIRIERSPRQRVDDIAHTEHHQGIVGYFHTRAPLVLDDVLDADGQTPLLLVLDGIQDPHNLGALSRTADAVGATGIVLPKHRAASVTAAAVKAAAGATEHLRYVTVPNIVHALERIGAAGVWRVGLDADGDKRYDECDYTGPVAIVIGSEGEGMRPLTRRTCDVIASIPMQGRVASLNATVAGSVLLYEVARQRGFTPR